MNKKIIFWSITGVALAVAGYVLWKKFGVGSKIIGSKKADVEPPPVVPSPIVTPKPADSPFPLKQGSVGENVVSLQKNLNILGANLKTDGKFGPLTQSALISRVGFGQYPVTEGIFNDIVKMAADKIEHDRIAKLLTTGTGTYNRNTVLPAYNPAVTSYGTKF